MLDSITAYLVQAKECNLPGIGYFKIVTHPASSDGLNKTILPPYSEIIFSNQPKQEEDFGLIKYLGAKLNLDEAAAERQLKMFCISMNNKLSLDKMIVFPSLGTLQRDAKGATFFQQESSLPLYEPVVAERVVHENANHALLIGDKETTSDKRTLHLSSEIKSDIKSKRQWWKVAALILFIVGVGIVLLQFYNHGLDTGNQTKLFPKDAPATYK